ncbi:MAG: ribose 5-phosphate isomerase B [Clostridiales bacterium]|nr:ribose 5-phosphate isomerase B [Clostridiales bacterium]
MRVAIGSDHGGYRLKTRLGERLIELGHEVLDLGPFDLESVDYPDYGFAVGEAVARGIAARGVVVCTSGIGISMAANKVSGVRCALCWNERAAELSRAHNDSNVLALGEGMVTEAEALAILDVWLATPFEGGRHARRTGKLDSYSPRAMVEI